MNRLRELREEKGYSLRELGEKLGMNASVLGNYERGDRQPKIEVWEKIAKFFEVTPAFLMGLSSVKDKSNFFPIDRSELTDQNKVILDDINELVEVLLNENNGWAAMQVQEVFKNLNTIISWSNNLDGDYSPVGVLAAFSSLVKDVSVGEFRTKEGFDEYFVEREQSIAKLDKLFVKRISE